MNQNSMWLIDEGSRSEDAPSMYHCEKHGIHEGYTDDGRLTFTFRDGSVLIDDGHYLLLPEEMGA